MKKRQNTQVTALSRLSQTSVLPFCCVNSLFFPSYLARCPCTNNFLYSVVMMAGPSLFLLGLGFMMSGGFWKTLQEGSKLKHFNERLNYRMKSLSRLFQPFLAPTAYITMVLLKGDIFVCSQIGVARNVACQGAVSDTKLSQVRTFEILAS